MHTPALRNQIFCIDKSMIRLRWINGYNGRIQHSTFKILHILIYLLASRLPNRCVRKDHLPCESVGRTRSQRKRTSVSACCPSGGPCCRGRHLAHRSAGRSNGPVMMRTWCHPCRCVLCLGVGIKGGRWLAVISLGNSPLDRSATVDSNIDSIRERHSERMRPCG